MVFEPPGPVTPGGGFPRFDRLRGELMLWIAPRRDGTPLVVDVGSLTAALAEVEPRARRLLRHSYRGEETVMKIVVIGGTGLIGSKVVTCLRQADEEAVAASPDSGVNTLTGDGLAEVLEGASVVVDVSNSPSFEDEAVMEFFTTSTTNQLEAEHRAGVRHHVALSIVGAERIPESGYLRAKVVQEKLIVESGIPYSIIHATQFFEFVTRIADELTDGDTVRAPTALIQPIAADDVAAAVCEISRRPPVDGVTEIAGPEQLGFEDFIRRGLEAKGDPRTVVSDPKARYFGAHLQQRDLVAGDGATLGAVRFDDWLA